MELLFFCNFVLHIFSRQAIDDVSRGHIMPGDKLYELKALQEANKPFEVGTNFLLNGKYPFNLECFL